MESEAVIRVENVFKAFKIPHEKHNSLKSAAINLFKKKTYTKYEAAKGISFEVKKGEFLGIIGRNGSGKSTMLKMLAGIYLPDKGKISVNGRLSPFLELGVGFNPELSARDNVYLNGTILGLNRKEIDDKFDEIIQFAELEEFIDQRLKNFSSGMQVRLAFSVAIQAHADVLLIDEVLAVGDTNFQRKCFEVFRELKKSGKTIVFVTHSMDMVKKFCDRVILINNGIITSEGEPEIVSYEYEQLNLTEKGKEAETEITGSAEIKITNPRHVHILNALAEIFPQKSRLINIGSNERIITTYLSKNAGVILTSIESVVQLTENTTPLQFDGAIMSDPNNSFFKKNDSILNIIKSKVKDTGLVYIHGPYGPYVEYINNKRGLSNGSFLDAPSVVEKMKSISFELIKMNTYGIDFENQYAEFIFKRSSKEDKDAQWGSWIK